VVVEAKQDLASRAHPLTGSFGAHAADLAVPRGTDVAAARTQRSWHDHHGAGMQTTLPAPHGQERPRPPGVAREADDVRRAIFLTGRFAALEARPDRSASQFARFDTPPLTTEGSPWLLIDHP